MEGWISLHRKLLDNPIASKPAYLSLWVTLLLLANHSDKEFIWKNEKYTCKRGQLVTSRAAISERTGISQSTVEDILRFLEKEGNIRQQSNSKFRLITVVNFNTYQEKQQRAIQPADSQPYTNNKENNENKSYRSVEYLKNIPQEDIQQLATTIGVPPALVVRKGDQLYDYCEAKGKQYKNYKAFLRNCLKEDKAKSSITSSNPQNTLLSGMKKYDPSQ